MYAVQRAFGNHVAQHLDRVVLDDALVTQALLGDQLAQAANARRMHFHTQIIILRLGFGNGRRGFAHTETDLQDTRRTTAERADFVRTEFRRLKVRVDDACVTALLDAVGSDIRELAAACSQLVADTGGHVDAIAVRRYHSGKAEVKGFDVADKAVVGDVAGAVEALRWARLRGEPHVVLADALAEAIHTIARVRGKSGDQYRLAGELGMPPWRVQKAQKQARFWPQAES